MIAPDALNRLEIQLGNMQAIAQLLMGLAPDEVDGKAAVQYLGGQLAQHFQDAREAFDEIHAAMVAQRVAPVLGCTNVRGSYW